MPTYDEEGPRVLHERSDLFTVGTVDVLRACAIDAHEEWQRALAASVEAQRAAKGALRTPRESFALDRAAALHEAAKRAELTYGRARDRWFREAPGKAAAYRRRFQFGDCL